MELHYYLPRADLREYVRAYYYFATPAASVQPLCAELGNIRILLDGDGELQMAGGAPLRITSTFLIGPTMSAYTMRANAGTRVFGIGIRPRGWVKLFSINAYEAADQVFDLTDVAQRVAGMELDAIRNSNHPEEMAAACDRYFTALLERRAQRRDIYPQAIENWLLNDQDLDIDRLMETIDVSRRQTDRLAKKYFGASPKLLQRKYRALRAADRIRQGEAPWICAAGPGFYDQSHFIKEFRRFIGVTPSQFLDNQAALLNVVRTKRGAEAFQLPLASL